MVQHVERSDARLNRERLLAAAAAEFAEHGADAEVKEIAERAGLSVGAVYRHFPSKDDLIAAILEQILSDFEQVIREATCIEDAAAAVRAFIAGALVVVEKHGGLVTAMLEGGVLKTPRAGVVERRVSTNALLQALIERGIRSGAFRADLDPLVAVKALESLLTPWCVAELRRTLSAEEVSAALAGLFLHGALADR